MYTDWNRAQKYAYFLIYKFGISWRSDSNKTYSSYIVLNEISLVYNLHLPQSLNFTLSAKEMDNRARKMHTRIILIVVYLKY